MLLDEDTCYRAVQARDRRFDGRFVTAVRTTGIYCRPSCPAITPRRRNVEFHRSAASAQRSGVPRLQAVSARRVPGSPDWDVRGDLAGRALRLIADGVLDREGAAGLAGRLGYSARQVQRTLVAEVGAGPLALARAQRAQTARTLLETTSVPVTDVAFSSGFASVRQFNETIREVFGEPPSALRRRHASAHASAAVGGTIALRLPYREPMDLRQTLGFLAARAVPGVEQLDGGVYRRTLRLPRGWALAELSDGRGHVNCRLRLSDHRDLVAALRRLRRLLDLDADPVAVDAVLGADESLAASVRRRPGLRSPGSVDGFEMAVRAIVGLQVSVPTARSLLGRIVAVVAGTPEPSVMGGAPVMSDGAAGVLDRPSPTAPFPTALFPTAEQVANLDPAALPWPRRRAATVHAVATAMASGMLALDDGADRAGARAALLAIPGIGSWTADYLVMRALADPDVLLVGDRGVRAAAATAGIDLADGRRDWAPWRSYATHHLWHLHR